MPQLRQSVGSYNNISLDDVCTLVSQTYVKDELNQEIEQDVERTVFCMVSSVNRAEFFQAGRNGHKPVMIIYMDAIEYDDQSELLYRDEKYYVYKVFFRTDGHVELSCEKRVGLGG